MRWLRTWVPILAGCAVVGMAGGLAVREMRRVNAEIAAQNERRADEARADLAELQRVLAEREAAERAAALWRDYDTLPPPKKTHGAVMAAYRKGLPGLNPAYRSLHMRDARRRLAFALHPEASAGGTDDGILLLPPDPTVCERIATAIRFSSGDWKEVGFAKMRCISEDGRTVYIDIR